MSELKASINRCQVIGVCKEINMEETTKEVTLKGSNGVEKKVTCQYIAKKEFKNPMLLVEANGGDIGIDFFPVAEKKLDENNNIVENPRFKSMKTVYETYVTKSKDAENATRVKVDGSLRANEYVDKNSYEYKSFPQISAFQITSTSVPEEDSTDSEISGVIHSIIEETRGENAEPTGRYVVELLTFDSNGAVVPLKFIVEEDIASDFNSFYEVGQSVKLYYEINVKQVGAKKPIGGGFGRRESHMISGFSVTEYSIFRGDEPFNDENEYYVDIDTVKKALNERETMKETKIKEAKEDKGGTAKSASPKGASSNAKSNPFGGSSTTTPTPKANPFA